MLQTLRLQTLRLQLLSFITTCCSLQAEELAGSRSQPSAEELRTAAKRERARLEAAGEIDRVWEAQGIGADAAPSFDSLVAKTLELRWKYYDQGKPVRARLLQCPHEVALHMHMRSTHGHISQHAHAHELINLSCFCAVVHMVLGRDCGGGRWQDYNEVKALQEPPSVGCCACEVA